MDPNDCLSYNTHPDIGVVVVDSLSDSDLWDIGTILPHLGPGLAIGLNKLTLAFPEAIFKVTFPAVPIRVSHDATSNDAVVIESATEVCAVRPGHLPPAVHLVVVEVARVIGPVGKVSLANTMQTSCIC